MPTPRDYASISPSARSLLLVKATTSLPFARAAAEALWGPDELEAAAREAAATPGAAGRRRHFELRARSVDAAIDLLGASRILEIAAGLSFRGLALAAARADVAYVDTDLPEMSRTKASLARELHPGPLAGTLRIEPLDALDAGAFRAAVRAFPPGPVAVVEEGLLMYLDEEEKRHLAASVHEALLERGGAWVTADIYVRSSIEPVRDERTKQFLEQHRVEEKKFADFPSAEAFFGREGFHVLHRLVPDEDPWPVRQTWIVEPAR
jgi:O-methyltransferase involved in polyketide biosynthesis